MRPSHLISAALHAALIAALVLAPKRDATRLVPPVASTRVVLKDWKPLVASGNPRAGGGSGQHDILRASRGAIPPRKRFSFPPALRDRAPKLAVEAGVDLPPALPVPRVEAVHFGDPFGVNGPLSGGRGAGGWPGDGSGSVPGPGRGSRGLGPGDQPGTFGPASAGGSLRPAVVIYRIDPEFSEDARKARYQGMVVLLIDIGPDGRASNFRVLQGLGMGLDEKAIEAVERWRFRPATRDGKPVVSVARVEVNFRLL